MKKKRYSLQEKIAYYKTQRTSSRAIGFLEGVDYARTHKAKQLFDTPDFKGSDMRSGFYAGIRAYNAEHGNKNKE